MKKLTYSLLSGFLILATTIPAGATTPTTTIVQSNTVAQSNAATIEQMFQQQKVLTNEIQALMAQVKTMMAEMKALTSLPDGQTPTMTDLYKQQQVILAKIELSQSRFDTLLPKNTATGRGKTATVQDIQQQQTVIIADLKTMMAELKDFMEVYRGRANLNRR